MPDPMTEQVVFRITPATSALLAHPERPADGPNGAARQIVHAMLGVEGELYGGKPFDLRQELSRYRWLLKSALSETLGILSPAEIDCVQDICMSTAFVRPEDALLLYADIEDAEPSFFERWEVDRFHLASKLKSLNRVQAMALTDHIENRAV